jgi:hypothetical protein
MPDVPLVSDEALNSNTAAALQHYSSAGESAYLQFVASLNLRRAIHTLSPGTRVILSWLAPPTRTTGEGDSILKMFAQACKNVKGRRTHTVQQQIG